MVKHIQTIHRLLPMNCLSVFDIFVGLALKGLIHSRCVVTKDHTYLNRRVGKCSKSTKSEVFLKEF